MSGYSITEKTKDAEIVRLPLNERRLEMVGHARSVAMIKVSGTIAANKAADHGKTLEQRRSPLDTTVYFTTLADKYKKFRESIGG